MEDKHRYSWLQTPAEEKALIEICARAGLNMKVQTENLHCITQENVDDYKKRNGVDVERYVVINRCKKRKRSIKGIATLACVCIALIAASLLVPQKPDGSTESDSTKIFVLVFICGTFAVLGGISLVEIRERGKSYLFVSNFVWAFTPFCAICSGDSRLYALFYIMYGPLVWLGIWIKANADSKREMESTRPSGEIHQRK